MSSYDVSRILSVPRAVAYYVNRLVGFSTNRVSLNMLTSTTCAAGSSFTVTLPANAIVDVDSLTLFFTNTISGLTAGKIGYRTATDLIQSIKVTINNNIVDHHDNFNQTCHLFGGYQGDARNTTAKLLSGNSQFPVENETAANLTAYNGDLEEIHAIQAWEMLGFIASCQPRIIDTFKMGDVKIEFTLANSDIFATDGNVVGNPTFNWSDIRMECNVLQFDSVFDQIINKVFNDGNALTIPFTRYVWNIGQSQALNNATMNVFVSSQSLDAVLCTFFDDTLANGNPGKWKSKGFVGYESNTLSTYFKRGHDNITHAELRLNQVSYPAYGRVGTDSALIMALNAMVGSDPNAGTSSKLDSFGEFKRIHYMLPVRLNFPTEDGNHTLSGVNTLGQNYQAQVTYYGGAGYVVPAVLLVSTSTLDVMAGRQIAVIN